MIALIGAYALLVTGWTVYKVRSLAMKQSYKTAVLYTFMMLFALVIGALQLAKVQLPSFILPFKLLFEPLGHLLLSS